MTRSSTRLAVALLAATALSACANQQTTRTGFIPENATLLATADDPATLAFIAPDARLAGYGTVIIEPVAFRRGPATPAEIDPAVVRGLSDAYAQALAAAFIARGYAPVTEPDGRTLRVRTAITGYERANVALNVLTTLVAAPVTAGGAASEAEVLDAATGERLVAMATHSNGTPFLGGPHNYYLEHGHARAALQRHANALAARLPARAADPR